MSSPAVTHQDVFSISLYARAQEYDAVINAIAANGGEITEALGLELSAVEDQFEVKAERVALFSRNLDAMASAVESEAQRLNELAANRRKTAASLRQYLFDMMTLTGKEHITRPLAELKIVQVGGSLPVKWAGTDEQIPLPYRVEKISYSLDRAEVLADAAAGKALPEGLTIGPRGKRLSIK